MGEHNGIMQFTGPNTTDMIQVKNETQKGAGDKITYGLRMQMTGAGTQGDGTLEGNEEALQTYTDAVTIDQLRHAHRSAGKMTEQRVTYNLRDEARSALADWWSDRLEVRALAA